MHEGQILAGKYRIEKVLGVGGMGVVVAARHLQLETKVAMKFLLPAMLSNTEAVQRFAREARAAVKITGEHVARVLDVGTLETGAPFMVMEFLEGSDLSEWLRQRGALPVEQAVEFVLQACVAVAEAHSLGIVHRDLKPANLFCIRRADGKLSAKVLDFGISKITDVTSSDGGMSMTKTSAMMGSPLYMSPEQMQASKDVDPQTDIWALGVILYELLTGRVPFEGDTITDVAIKVAMQPAAPVRTLRPDVPPGLDAAVLRCLEKSKAERYRNVAELAMALRDFAPTRAKPLVERICDILKVAGPGASVAPPDRLHGAEPAGTTVAAATMSAVGRTTGGMRGGGKKSVAIGVLAVVGALGVAAIAVVALRKPADARTVAAGQPVGVVASAASLPAGPPPTPLPSLPQDTTATRLAEPTPEPPPAAQGSTKAPARPASQAGTPGRRAAAAAAPPPPVAPPAPAPAPRAAAPAPRRNPMDLGNFQ